MIRHLLALLLLVLSTAAGAQNALHIPADAARAYPTFVRPVPTYVDARVLAANTNESHTVPANAKLVLFSSNCAAFYAKAGGTAAVPATDVTDGTGSELNPAGYYVDAISASGAGLSTTAVTSIGLISPTACTVTLAWYLK